VNGNKKLANLHTAQPTFYGFSSSDARAGDREFNRNEIGFVDSRDQSGPAYRTF